VAEWSGRSLDHGGGTCVVVEHPKVDISDFEKIKSKNCKKVANLESRWRRSQRRC
jgi:hypothetical protein